MHLFYLDKRLLKSPEGYITFQLKEYYSLELKRSSFISVVYGLDPTRGVTWMLAFRW